VLRIDEKIERDQVARLRAIRERRDAAKAAIALAELEGAARGTANLLPRILDCVEAELTVGEISHRMRSVWGEYHESITL